MQKKSLQILFLTIFSAMLLATMVQFVHAQTPTTQPASAIFDPVYKMFTDWSQGQLSVNIAKYVLWMLLLVVIYGIADYFPGMGGDNKVFLKFVIALLVSFLATAYLTPSDVYTALASYGALGITMSAVIPFVVLLFFSISIEQKGGVGGRILTKFIWFGFIIFLIWKVITGIYFCNSGVGARCIDITEGWIYIGIIILSLIWTLWMERVIYKWMFKEQIKAVKDKVFQEIEARDLVDTAKMREYQKMKKRVGKDDSF